MKFSLVIGILLGLFLSPFLSHSSEAWVKHDRNYVVFGDISDEPVKKIKKIQPLADYVSARLGKYGITHGEVIIARNIDHLIDLFNQGKVDVYMDSPYPAMMVCSNTKGVPVLRRWKRGTAEYSSVIFTRSDSDINLLSDLMGNTIAFDDNFSTSGFMLPLAHLCKQGMELSEIRNLNDQVSGTDVNWILSGDDQNTIQWVLSGKVEAGTVGSSDLAALPSETLSHLKVIGSTPMVPRQIVVMRKGNCPQFVKDVKKILMEMENNKEGAKILRKFKKTKRFDEELPERGEFFSITREYYSMVQEYLDNLH